MYHNRDSLTLCANRISYVDCNFALKIWLKSPWNSSIWQKFYWNFQIISYTWSVDWFLKVGEREDTRIASQLWWRRACLHIYFNIKIKKIIFFNIADYFIKLFSFWCMCCDTVWNLVPKSVSSLLSYWYHAKFQQVNQIICLFLIMFFFLTLCCLILYLIPFCLEIVFFEIVFSFFLF